MTKCHGATCAEAPPRSIPRLLLAPEVGPFFGGTLALATGLWAFNVTVAVLAFSLTGSSLFVGAVTGAQFAAPMLLSLASGKRADRGDRLGQVLLGQSIGLSALLVLIIWGTVRGLSGSGTPYVLLAVAASMGLGFAVSAPALQAVVPNLVARNELQPAVTIHAAMFNLGRAIGPAMAGLLLASAGALWSFTATAGCYAVFVTAVLRVRRGRSVRLPTPRPSGERSSARLVLRNRPLRIHLMGVAVTALVADPVITLAPAFADTLGVGSGWIGAMTALFGVGAASILLIAGTAQERFGLMGAARLGLAALAIAIVGLGNWPDPAITIGLALVAGAGFLLCLSSLTAAIQQNAAEHQRGVTMALWTVAFLGSRPLSALVNGLFAELWSPGVATVLVAGVGGLFSLLLNSRHEPDR